MEHFPAGLSAMSFNASFDKSFLYSSPLEAKENFIATLHQKHCIHVFKIYATYLYNIFH